MDYKTCIPLVTRSWVFIIKDPILCSFLFYLCTHLTFQIYTGHPLFTQWVSDQGFKSQLTILQSYRDWNKIYQAQWLGLWTRSCLYVMCMYWTRLVRPPASLYSASPLKHHTTGKQWCPNPDPYPDSEPASQSLIPLCWEISRSAELQT